jgi:hypothetical protein
MTTPQKSKFDDIILWTGRPLFMINSKLIILLTITSFGLFSCNNNSEQISQVQTLKDSGNVQHDDSIVNRQGNEAFILNEEVVRKAFLEYLPDISDGRSLNKYSSGTNDKGYKILLGDLNGDNLPDGVVDYSLEPTLEDNGGGGNAIAEIPGLIAFVNTGRGIIIADHSESFPLSTLKKINNGVIILEGLAYANDDPRCCPSIKTSIKAVLRNNKLIELK